MNYLTSNIWTRIFSSSEYSSATNTWIKYFLSVTKSVPPWLMKPQTPTYKPGPSQCLYLPSHGLGTGNEHECQYSKGYGFLREFLGTFCHLIFMISSLLLTLDLLVLIFLVTSDVMLGCLFEICLTSWSKCVSLQELLLLQPIDFEFFVCLFSFFCRYFLHFFYDLFIDPLVVQQHIV